ncbi:MAG: hypothetical protein LBM99_05780, partial [Bacillales bacterium]|nr:hypothetical protein [Bacillales bacterium]
LNSTLEIKKVFDKLLQEKKKLDYLRLFDILKENNDFEVILWCLDLFPVSLDYEILDLYSFYYKENMDELYYKLCLKQINSPKVDVNYFSLYYSQLLQNNSMYVIDLQAIMNEKLTNLEIRRIKEKCGI